METLLFAGLPEADAALVRAAPEARRAQLMAEYRLSALRERRLLCLESLALTALPEANALTDEKTRERALDRLLEVESALTRVQGHLRGVVQDMSGREAAAPPEAEDARQLAAIEALLDAPAPDRSLP